MELVVAGDRPRELGIDLAYTRMRPVASAMSSIMPRATSRARPAHA